jgi:putative membrane protein
MGSMGEYSPSVIGAILVLGAIYTGASWKLGQRPNSRQILALGLALIVMCFALTGPIDYYVRERSFALYIFQQMLLVFVIPPLILLSLPDWMARAVFTQPWIEPVWRIITRPVIAFLTFSAAFTLIHYPLLCDHICHVRPPYGDIRDLLLIVGVVLWWPLLSPLPEFPRMSYPTQIMYLFLLMIPMTAVAAPITMAETVLYMFYRVEPHPFGLTPHADQVLGGLIMWVGQGVYLMCIFTAIFFRWSRRDDREIPAINLRRAPDLRIVQRPSA